MDSDFSDIPVELRRILLDFTFTCLIKKHTDFVQLGCEYFANLIESRKPVIQKQDEPILRDSQISNLRILTERWSSVNDSNPGIDGYERVVHAKSKEERMRLASFIKDKLFFRDLDDEEFSCILDAMYEKIVHKGEIIIQEGSTETDSFFVVSEGIYETSVNIGEGRSKVVRIYDNSGSFGEIALMYNCPRAATVTAITEGKLWVLDRGTFREIVVKDPHSRRERFKDLIQKVEFLQILTDHDKSDLADSFVPLTYEDNEEIFHQGDSADGMYFVEAGGVKCLMDYPNVGVIKILKPGDYFGELALVTNQERALSTRAIGETKLAFLKKENFTQLLGPCVEFLKTKFEDYNHALDKALKQSS